MSLASMPSDWASRMPCSRSSRSMRMSVSRISAPMNSRAFGRQSACLAKTGSRLFAASTRLVLDLLARVLEQHPLVGHPGAVVDAVVDRQAVAQILEDRARAKSERSSGSAG